MKRAACLLFAAAMALSWAALLLCPASRVTRAQGERYTAVWEEGETQESYLSAYPALVGAGEAGVLLERDKKQGYVPASEAYMRLYPVLEGGGLNELLASSAEGVTRLERAALWRTFSPRLWYADEYFGWTEEGFTRRELPEHGDGSLVLFSEPPAPRELAALGIRLLVMREGSAVTAEDLVGTQVEEIRAQPPYSFAEGVLTRSTPGGERIVCAVPPARTLVLPDVPFADEGALLACENLQRIQVPFVGDRADGRGEHPEFAHLFSTGREYRVPASLRAVKVTGGTLRAHAFYACAGVEEIDACGISARDISRQAFSGCEGLRSLHCPRADVQLSGTFARETLACGCTLFTRTA